jgi:hypothetical protein
MSESYSLIVLAMLQRRYKRLLVKIAATMRP